MGYEIQGEDTDFGHEVYTRRAKLECHALGVEWAGRMQGVLDTGKLIRPPVREIGGGGGSFEGVVTGLRMLQTGDNRGGKVVVRLWATGSSLVVDQNGELSIRPANDVAAPCRQGQPCAVDGTGVRVVVVTNKAASWLVMFSCGTAIC